MMINHPRQGVYLISMHKQQNVDHIMSQLDISITNTVEFDVTNLSISTVLIKHFASVPQFHAC